MARQRLSRGATELPHRYLSINDELFDLNDTSNSAAIVHAMAMERQRWSDTLDAERARTATHVHDLLASVAFLRSVIAAGESLNADDNARLRDVYEKARAALATPAEGSGE